MKSFIFHTLWGALLAALVALMLAVSEGMNARIFFGILFAGCAVYIGTTIVRFIFWIKSSPEEREIIRKDKEGREKPINRRQIFALIIFSLFLVVIGRMVHWHPLYTVPVVIWFGGGALLFVLGIPSMIRKTARERREVVEAEKKKLALKQAQKEIEENEKKDPQLVGPAEASPGKIALGWLIDQDKNTKRHTAELKTADKADREAHFYIVGASGMGKTKLLEALILQDAKQGQGFGVIDPHGDLIEDIKIHLAYNPGPKDQRDAELRAKFLMERVVLIDPTDKEQIACFNPLELYPGVPASELSGEMVMIFKKIWADSWGPRLEDMLRNSFIALAEAGLTICDLPDFLTDAGFRRKTLARVHNDIALSSFRHFEMKSDGAKNEIISPVLNKINALLIDDNIRQLFLSPKSTFNLRDIIDSGKILLVKLNKGRLKGSADLLGSLIVAKIQMAAFSRSDTPYEKRRPFYLYIDEFQNFATEHFLETLAEARKYRLHLILAHQNLSQLPERLQAAILTNSDVQMYFRTSHQDARILARESSEQPAQLSGFDKMVGETDPLHNNKRYDLEGQRWGDREQLLKDLPPRYFILKNKNESGAVLVKTDRIPDPLAADENTAQKSRELANFFVGGLYLRKRSELSRHGRGPEEKEDPEEPQTFREKRGS